MQAPELALSIANTDFEGKTSHLSGPLKPTSISRKTQLWFSGGLEQFLGLQLNCTEKPHSPPAWRSRAAGTSPSQAKPSLCIPSKQMSLPGDGFPSTSAQSLSALTRKHLVLSKRQVFGSVEQSVWSQRRQSPGSNKYSRTKKSPG